MTKCSSVWSPGIFNIKNILHCFSDDFMVNLKGFLEQNEISSLSG